MGWDEKTGLYHGAGPTVRTYDMALVPLITMKGLPLELDVGLVNSTLDIVTPLARLFVG